MAQIKEELVVIKVSQMMRDGRDDVESVVAGEFMSTIESVVQELVPETAIVEVVSGDE